MSMRNDAQAYAELTSATHLSQDWPPISTVRVSVHFCCAIVHALLAIADAIREKR